MISTIRKILVAIAWPVIGGALGYVTGSLIDEDVLVTAVKYAVLTGMAVGWSTRLALVARHQGRQAVLIKPPEPPAGPLNSTF